MAGVGNGGFEVGGLTPGQASQWSISSTQAGEDTALFDVLLEGLDTPQGAESFSWVPALSSLDDVTTEAADFDPDFAETKTVEDFEEGWQNDAFILDLSANTARAVFDSSTPEDVEDFEEEWLNNESFILDWSGVTADAASFDSGTPQDFEDFEHEWHDNENFENDWTDVTSSTAQFDVGVPQNFEDFENEWPDLVMVTL